MWQRERKETKRAVKYWKRSRLWVRERVFYVRHQERVKVCVWERERDIIFDNETDRKPRVKSRNKKNRGEIEKD